MALTWTRFVPDHYDSAAQSPPSPADTVVAHPFPFMRLPVEIRLQAYREYLLDRYSPSPAEIHEMVLDTCDWEKPPAEILQVSKAVNAEVQDLLRHETAFNLRICWQDATFDGLAVSCFRARGKPLDYDGIAHLRIEIYPAHPDRYTDMIRVWRQVQKVCSDLQGASCVQNLSLHFMENQYATWSLDGEPRGTMGMSCNAKRLPSDVLHILDLFKLLANVAKAQIHLPVSLNEDVSLQESKRDTEDVMMQIKSLDHAHQKLVIKTIEEAIAENEEDLKYVTGSNSHDKLDRLCGYGHWISNPHFDIFEKVWPHRDSVFEWEYRPRSQYIGDESLENAPLDYVDPYDSDDYY